MEIQDKPVARVIAEYKGAYRVKNEEGEFLAKVTGKQMFEASSRIDYPAVGDWVLFDNGIIHGIVPRKSIISRRSGREEQVIAANIDVAFIVESIDRDYSLNRFERYIAIAKQGGVKPAVIINKKDLIQKEDLENKIKEIKNRLPGIDILLTSAFTSEGLSELKKYIEKGKTYCFLGSSGVGKSSLINKLIGEDEIKTGEISSYSGRGKHITTTRQMYFLKDGGIVIDNPGMREVGVIKAESAFEEITSFKNCKYSDCTHIHEPGCEVIKAVEAGKLDKDKYSNYVSLKKEAQYYDMTKLEKREKDRKFGKFLNKAKKDIKKYKN